MKKSNLFLLTAIALMALLFFLFNIWNIPRIYWFLLLGSVEGIYYGWFNNEIFHNSAKFNNNFERTHALYIHFICGIACSLSLFILYIRFPFSRSEFSLGDSFLLVFGLLGVVGLLPRTFWFLANSGDIFSKFK